jgi:Flp pilus assembly protein TadG
MTCKKIKYRNTTKRPSGQALIEFALVLPLLLVLIISAIEIGRLFFTKIVVTNAAREGAYYYATNPSSTDLTTLRSRAEMAARAEAANSGVAIDNVTFFATGTGSFSKIEVTVNSTVEDLLILRVLGNVFAITGGYENFTLSSTVEMMVQ